MNPSNAPTVYGNTGNGNSSDGAAGLTALAALASLGSKGSSGYSESSMISAIAASDNGFRIKDAESNIVQTILEQTISNDKQFCDTDAKIMQGDKESQVAIQAAITQILAAIAHCCEETSEKIDHVYEELTEKLTDFEKNVDAKFCDLQLREKDEVISNLKVQLADKAQVDQTSLLTQILSALKPVK